jgi:hypothetical protein
VDRARHEGDEQQRHRQDDGKKKPVHQRAAG